MTVKDLIVNKDYDYISWRLNLSEDLKERWKIDSVFSGSCYSKNGELISNDIHEDFYDDEIVIRYEEWSTDEIKNGLTVVVEAEWS